MTRLSEKKQGCYPALISSKQRDIPPEDIPETARQEELAPLPNRGIYDEGHLLTGLLKSCFSSEGRRKETKGYAISEM